MTKTIKRNMDFIHHQPLDATGLKIHGEDKKGLMMRGTASGASYLHLERRYPPTE